MTITLATPHIAVGAEIDEAVAVLQRFGRPTREDSEREYCYRVETPLFGLAVYPQGVIVRSVWYDDPTGRETEQGRINKVHTYLTRYGPLTNWELRLDNGWMHYWFNPVDHAQMVYGLHKDVIRFNQYDESRA
ncbi:hypothetical protein NMQ14_17880 [Methyloversatilis sp. XJ19-13]|uniref:hypothetical protein n=1 Tax=unclassified Methyloversatilis TaxID=2639971 RepID=UPI00211CB530|nr:MULTISPECIES: hypothetical protein [unclassified Methyloversatilis]MCQ9376120.1 hypothetical protein [Methyloversatilis sp. XJ19-13]